VRRHRPVGADDRRRPDAGRSRTERRDLHPRQREASARASLADTAFTTALGATAGLADGLYAARFADTLLFDVAPLDTSSVVERRPAARRTGADGYRGGGRPSLAIDTLPFTSRRRRRR
jgi:hypothetical protein